MGDFLEVSKMAVEEGGSNGQEIRVTRVVNLDHSPGVLTRADLASTDLDNFLGSDNGEGHQPSELGVLLNRILVILFNVVREVVNRDTVVFDILHDKLLGLCKLGRSKRVGTADDGNNIDARRQALHELDIQLAETDDDC